MWPPKTMKKTEAAITNRKSSDQRVHADQIFPTKAPLEVVVVELDDQLAVVRHRLHAG